MNVATFILVLTVFWVVAIFVSLPIGVKIPKKPKPGHASSAPSKHHLGKKIFLTFAISLVATLVYWYIIIHFPNIFDFLKE